MDIIVKDNLEFFEYSAVAVNNAARSVFVAGCVPHRPLSSQRLMRMIA